MPSSKGGFSIGRFILWRMPIRLMSGLLILKQMFDLGDETVIPEWIRDPYFQYFCGEACFNWQQPCDPSDLVHFRKRIGENGTEKIFQQSISISRKKSAERRNYYWHNSAGKEHHFSDWYKTSQKNYWQMCKNCRERKHWIASELQTHGEKITLKKSFFTSSQTAERSAQSTAENQDDCFSFGERIKKKFFSRTALLKFYYLKKF